MLGGWQSSFGAEVGTPVVHLGAGLGLDRGFDDYGNLNTVTGKISISAGIEGVPTIIQVSTGRGKSTKVIPYFKF
jgi:hypothetical protein